MCGWAGILDSSASPQLSREDAVWVGCLLLRFRYCAVRFGITDSVAGRVFNKADARTQVYDKTLCPICIYRHHCPQGQP